MKEAIENIKSRRSIRKFLSQPVDKKIIKDIIDCARLAPTANNIQPWEFIVITDSATRKELGRICDYGKFIAQAPVCIVVFCKETKYYLEDGSAATENILLAAHSYGLGSCWVAGDKKTYAEKIRQLLKAPQGYKLVSLIPIGYTNEQPKVNKRALKEVIHWEYF
ncbi:MAG: nitroreductase family protein [Elusimicrobiota bacterium]|nr:nitroreductase family protein [Elusimicrobiota bacterium]